MFDLDINLDDIRNEYGFVSHYGLNNPHEYLNALHLKAFCKNREDRDCCLSLACLLVFFAFKCKEFSLSVPKNEYGTAILDIADLYKEGKEPSQEQYNEAITSILLEFHTQGFKVKESLYLITLDYTSHPDIESPSLSTGFCSYDDQSSTDKQSAKEKSMGGAYAKHKILSNAIKKGEFKNKQVRDRAIKAFTMLNYCEQ